MSSRSGSAGAAVAGGIVGVAIDEALFVGPRLQRARQAGKLEGRQERDFELQPILRQLQADREQLIARLREMDRRSAELSSEIQRLRGELPNSARKALPGPH